MKSLLIYNEKLLKKLLKTINEHAQVTRNLLGVSHAILVRNHESKVIAENSFLQFSCPVFTIFEAKVKID